MDVTELDGNYWISKSQHDKASIVLGILLENGYICNHNTTFSPDNSNNYLAFIYHNQGLIETKWLSMSNIINKKAPTYAHMILTTLLWKFSNSNDFFSFYIDIACTGGKPLNFFKNSLKLLKETLNRNYSTLNTNKLKKSYLTLTIAYLVSLKIKEDNNYLNQLQKYCLYNTSVKQLVDGLDNFYQDFRNRDIKIGDAIYIVKRQIMGENEEVIKKIIRYLKTGNSSYMFYKKDDQIHLINFPP